VNFESLLLIWPVTYYAFKAAKGTAAVVAPAAADAGAGKAAKKVNFESSHLLWPVAYYGFKAAKGTAAVVAPAAADAGAGKAAKKVSLPFASQTTPTLTSHLPGC